MRTRSAQLSHCGVAVDLGATRTRIHIRGEGVVVDEPSLTAVDTKSRALVAVGEAARHMQDRTPGNVIVRCPISDGMIQDTELAKAMVEEFLKPVTGRWHRTFGSVVASSLPHGAGPVARAALEATLREAGFRRCVIVDTPVAAATGAGLPVRAPGAVLIMLCGTATTQVAVLSMGHVVTSVDTAFGARNIDHAIEAFIRHMFGITSTGTVLHDLYRRLAVAPADGQIPVTGIDAISGLPRTVPVDTADLHRVIQGPYALLRDSVGRALRRCPPDLVADLADRGLTVMGGAAFLPGLTQALRDDTGVPVHTAPDPAHCVIDGLGMMIESRSAAHAKDAAPDFVPETTGLEAETTM
ncbi:rod shape-determining protein [Yinghuangia sp. ASG 101]|uniref:rod shape-determining protein n=1 Tax=Yinghuangia sp. ASG 101 TaxID=2896848 RepID=UPI001E45AFAA|nr:rod shape-determining protein [Yinghuangia sp. ASG 101]UGQ10801.1 rod shape-determining protein [Yinghuangia sp. ASG 101]